jgi:hypothetical protein
MTTRSTTIDGIDPAAPVLARLSRRIEAPLDAVWNLHVDIPRWSDWQWDIEQAAIAEPFSVGAMFVWRTRGIDQPISSTIYAIEPRRRTLWGGPAKGIEGIHEWRFAAEGGATIVHTEESWSGGGIGQNAVTLQAALYASLERWLKFLADRAE